MPRWSLFAACFIIALGGVYGGWKLYKRLTLVDLSAPPAEGLAECAATGPGSPSGADASAGGEPTPVTAIAVGDSLTRGNMSYDYVDAARTVLRDDPDIEAAGGYGRAIRLLNAGVNGDRLVDIAARLDRVIECQPDLVTVLAGTNDALRKGTVPRQREPGTAPETGSEAPLELGPELRGPELRGPELWAAEAAQLDAVLHRLKRETTARIAVFLPPMAGDDPGTPLNQRMAGLARALRTVAEKHAVAVHDPWPAQDQARRIGTSGETPPAPCNTVTDVFAAIDTVSAQVRRRGAPIDYDTLAEARGHRLVIDCVHLSKAGASTYADALVTHARDALASRAQTGR